MIPSALTSRECALLSTVARERHVYEAGALFGCSTIALAQQARSVVSVDPHEGYPFQGAQSTWGPYLENLYRSGKSSLIRSIQGYFQNVPIAPGVSFAWADLTGTFDLTFAFLTHAHRVPLVAIHDYQREGCKGATDAVDFYIRKHRPRVYRVDTTILLEKRA